MAETAIEWATHVWNPVTGCDRVSPGCANCYALTYAARLKAMGQAKYQRDGGRASGPGFGLTMHEAELDAPLRWRAPRRVFVNSMSDLFHEEVTDDFIRRVFHRMAETPQHTYMVLTKRPQRMRDLLREWATPIDPSTCCDGCVVCWHDYSADFPLPNVWLGVSIENRRFVHRADLLRETPAAVRFISAEPLLGDLRWGTVRCTTCRGYGSVEPWDGSVGGAACPDCGGDGWIDASLNLQDIDWLIVGGESGHGARPMHEQWVRDLRNAAEDAGTAFFFKQWGGRTPKAGGRELDGRTWDELPATATEVSHA